MSTKVQVAGDLTLGNSDTMDAIRTNLEAMEIGELIGLFFETQIVKLCMGIMSIFIMVIVCGRMIEIYFMVSIAPVPLSTMVNRVVTGKLKRTVSGKQNSLLKN